MILGIRIMIVIQNLINTINNNLKNKFYEKIILFDNLHSSLCFNA